MTRPLELHDEMQNNLLAAGALFAALSVPGVSARAEIETEDGKATNRLRVHFPFLKSPYRVTVERVADAEVVA